MDIKNTLAENPNLLSSLNRLNALTRPRAENLYYNRKTVPLDGYSFHGCRFDRCKLVVKSGDFTLINCVIDSECEVVFEGNVQNVVKLYRHVQYFNSDDLLGEYNAVANDDGTITISSR